MIEQLELIRQQLESPDSEERIAAVRQMLNLPEPSMRLFVLGLGDEDWRVRKVAVETFFGLAHPENLIEELIELLHQQENAGLRNAAIEILVGLGSVAVPELQREISCPDVEVRKFVIDILGEIGDARCANELIIALSDPDINVRYAAAETLGKLRVDAAVGPLLALMEDPDPGLKFTILQSLSLIGGTIPVDLLVPYLDDRLLRKALFDCFGKIGGPEVVPLLVSGLTDPMRQVRAAALNALFALQETERDLICQELAKVDSSRIAAYLDQMLRGEDSPLKQAALAIYAAVWGQQDLTPVLNCVDDEHLRDRALQVFAHLGEQAFCRLLETHAPESAERRLYLIFVAGELGFGSALPLAIDAAKSADPQLRYAAARALGELGSEEQLELLLRLLDDEQQEIRDAAALGLAALGRRCRAVVPSRIAEFLADHDDEKRMRIVRILSLIDGDDIERQLLRAIKDPASNVRCEAIRALKGHDSDNVLSGLILTLTDESADVRRLAVSALGDSGKDRVLPALKLSVADADLWVRAAVMRALAHFSGERVRDLLLLGATDSVGAVVIAALDSAAEVLPGDRCALLADALRHADEEVVKAAMVLLERFKGKTWIIPSGELLLNHSHWDVRLRAARALGASGVADVSAVLEKRLAVEGEDLVRQAIEAALAELRHGRQRVG